MDRRSSSPSRPRVQRHRDDLRRRGMRPIQIWVPDTRSPAFKAEALRQSRLIGAAANEPEEREIMEFIERNAVWPPYDGE